MQYVKDFKWKKDITATEVVGQFDSLGFQI